MQRFLFYLAPAVIPVLLWAGLLAAFASLFLR
jgi:hypothetical protein